MYKEKKILLTLIISLLALTNLPLAEARRVINPNLPSPFIVSNFEDIIIRINRGSKYEKLISLWMTRRHWDSIVERVSYLLEVLNLTEETLIFDEKVFKIKYPTFWEEIVACRVNIEEIPSQKEEFISDLLWQGLDEEEKRIFKVVAIYTGSSYKELLFDYIKDLNYEFILHYILNPNAHFVLRDFISSQLRDLGLPYLEDTLSKYSHELLEKIINFIEVGLEVEEAWKGYVNIIKELPVFLSLLKQKRLCNYGSVESALKINLECANSLEELRDNFISSEELIRRFPTQATPSQLSYVLDNSFALSAKISVNFCNINKALANLIQILNKVDGFSFHSVKSLLSAARISAKGNSKIFEENLEQISEFIESLEVYKEFLRKDGKEIKLEKLLLEELPKIAEETSEDHLLFRAKLSDLVDKLTKDARRRFNEIVTSKNIEEALASLYNQNIVPTPIKVAEKLGLPLKLLIHTATIKKITQETALEKLLNSLYLEQIMNSRRPLNPEDIKFFIANYVVNGLTLKEIVRKFFILDEDGSIIKKKDWEAINSFISSSEFKAEGNLILSPQEFKRFLEDINSASKWLKKSHSIFVKPAKFDKYGIKPERVGENGEIIAVARHIYHDNKNFKFEINSPERLSLRFYAREKGYIIALMLGNLFVSGTELVTKEYGGYCYRIIDDNGLMIAEFNKFNKKEVIAVYFWIDEDECWYRWDPAKNQFDKDKYYSYSYWGKFLNSIVRDWKPRSFI